MKKLLEHDFLSQMDADLTEPLNKIEPLVFVLTGKTTTQQQRRDCMEKIKDYTEQILAVVSKALQHTKQLEATLDRDCKENEHLSKRIDFVETVDHELRTPMNAVLGFGSVLAETPDDDIAELAECSMYILSGFFHVKQMLESIYYMSRIDSDTLQYQMETFDGVGLLSQLYGLWIPFAPEGVELKYAATDQSAMVNADVAKVKHIINGVLGDAVRFTSSGSISMSAEVNQSTNQLMMKVSDTGCGIPEDKISTIFEMFTKGDPYISGLGIGLCVSRRMANGMGGTLMVDSKEGVGTNAVLMLPIVG